MRMTTTITMGRMAAEAELAEFPAAVGVGDGEGADVDPPGVGGGSVASGIPAEVQSTVAPS